METKQTRFLRHNTIDVHVVEDIDLKMILLSRDRNLSSSTKVGDSNQSIQIANHVAQFSVDTWRTLKYGIYLSMDGHGYIFQLFWDRVVVEPCKIKDVRKIYFCFCASLESYYIIDNHDTCTIKLVGRIQTH